MSLPVPEQVLFQAIAVALERLPDHRIEITEEGWELLARKRGEEGGGVIFESHRGTVVVRLADHEDRVVLTDQVRRAGGTLVESPTLTIGVYPADPA